MNQLTYPLLKDPACEQDPDSASKNIFELLTSSNPCMISRFGGFELSTVANYIGITQLPKSFKSYITGKTPAWWWETKLLKSLNLNAGFFPLNIENVRQFCELMLNDAKQIDILGSWRPEERFLDEELRHAAKINFELLNPYFAKNPWTKALENKKVLVVHPFAQTIKTQYKNRHLIFPNNLLPEFQLKTIKAVQSVAGEKTSFSDWFEALDYMKGEIDKIEYDICLIGCGAYGLPLAAHVKRSGKKGFHLGGSLQLLFGIRGKRWENINYNPKYNYASLINEYWVKPDESEKPVNAITVEGACYW